MSVINSVLLAVIDLVNMEKPYASVVIGALPADNGLSMTIGAGAPATTFMTKGMAYEIDLVFNGKHSNAQTVSDTLNDLHQVLTQAKSYPSTDEYQITNIETSATPSYLSREENNQILYGSALRVKFFYKA